MERKSQKEERGYKEKERQNKRVSLKVCYICKNIWFICLGNIKESLGS